MQEHVCLNSKGQTSFYNTHISALFCILEGQLKKSKEQKVTTGKLKIKKEN
jgi:hypothetical protein